MTLKHVLSSRSFVIGGLLTLVFIGLALISFVWAFHDWTYP